MNLGLRLFRTLHKQSFACAYSTKLPSELVVFMDDNMVVCWHPEQPYPYEFTKPLPVKEPQPESVLKIGNKEVNAVFKRVNPELVPEELGRLTYTTKHKWYPRARDKKAKKTLPDRPYM